MKFARSGQIFNAIRQDLADRPESASGAADAWPAWTDEVRFGIAPEPLDRRPQLSADPTPRRAGKAVSR